MTEWKYKSKAAKVIMLTAVFVLIFHNPCVRSAEVKSFPLVLADSAGREVRLETLPERLVVIGRGPHMILHILYMFPEAPSRVVGFEDRSTNVNQFLGLIDPDIGGKTRLGTYPGPEEVAGLKPDLVLMKGGREDKVGQALSDFGIPVMYMGLETPGQFFSDLENLGLLLGNPARAFEIASFYRIRLDRFQAVLGSIREESKPRILVVSYTERGSKAAVKVPARSWMQTIQTVTAGGRPVWAEATQTTDGWSVVHFEQVAAWNPDQIFIVIWHTMDPEVVIDSLRKDPLWQKLKAVQNDKLHVFPSDMFGWDSPEPRWILGMSWLAAKIHPDRYRNFDIKEELYSYFKTLYGLDSAVVDTHIMPRIRM